MSLRSEYIAAIEQRLAWLRWAQSPVGHSTWSRLGYTDAMPAYIDVLNTADTFYMAPAFAQLVEHARQTVPDELAYDPQWLIAPRGWLWLPHPFQCPTLEGAQEINGRPPADPMVRALAWRPIAEGQEVYSGTEADKWVDRRVTTRARANTTQFLMFQDFRDYYDAVRIKAGTYEGPSPQEGFGCWSYFMLEPGQTVGSRIELFESKQTTGKYVQMADRRTHPLHEMRLLWATLYLMAQRLATTVQHETDRATRRRAERHQQVAPPFIRVVTLRRLEEARPKNPTPAEVDWQWQWHVRGHWRNQFHPSDGSHKPVFIEAYIKGPEDKPLKPDSHKLFAARR